MFITALFTIAKIGKQPKCSSADEWIMKMCHIFTMEYYSAIKKNKILPFATTWMDLEDIMLSETRSSQKTNIMLLLICCYGLNVCVSAKFSC